MSSRSRLVLWLFALVGLGVSSMAAYIHYRLLRDPSYASFCDVSSTVNCSEAYLSKYGTLWGVPVALLGTVFFVAVLVLLVTERGAPRAVQENVPGYVFAASTVGLSVVLYLGYAAFFILKAVCLLCVTTYVAVIVLFLVSGSATRFPMTTLPGRAVGDLRRAATRPLALLVLILFFAGAASAIAFFPREVAREGAAAASPAQNMQQDQRGEVERWFDSQPRAIVPVESGGAAVLIVKFNDYQCPPCRQTFEQYKPILAKYAAEAPGKVKFVTKDFPLDPECNSNTPNGGHMAACEAAVAVRLARQKNQAEKLEDWLFANQPSLTPEVVKTAVRDVAGVTDFDARYSATLQQVKADTALGGLLGVRATPTFFINGVKIDGGIQPQYLDAIIAHELKKAAK